MKAALFLIFIVVLSGGCHIKTGSHETSNGIMAVHGENSNNIQKEAVQPFNEKTMDSVKIKESEGGDIFLERIGNSIYVRFFYDHPETRRYMDITSLMNADEFMRISNRIAALGEALIVQKPSVNIWEYGIFSTAHELPPYWECPRYDIYISNENDKKFMFIYYPEGYDVDIERYWLDVWNFNVPGYRKGHVYVMIYSDTNRFTDSLTDEELFQASEIQIQNLMKIHSH